MKILRRVRQQRKRNLRKGCVRVHRESLKIARAVVS